MSIDASEVARIAHLARLQVGDEDAARYAHEITGILGLVEQMQSVDTADVEPMAHPLDAAQPLRADEVTEVDQRTLYQGTAPAVEDGLYLVPRVVE